jgi:hypothetical protein
VCGALLAVLGRVLPVLALSATLVAGHGLPTVGAPSPVGGPLVTMQRVPVPALPAVGHCLARAVRRDAVG